MAKQGFKSTIAFLIANGCMETIENIQWNGCAEELAKTLIDSTYDMTFMGSAFTFDKSHDQVAIVIANIIIRMLQGKWEYEIYIDSVDPDLTVSRLNKAKKLISSTRTPIQNWH